MSPEADSGAVIRRKLAPPTLGDRSIVRGRAARRIRGQLGRANMAAVYTAAGADARTMAGATASTVPGAFLMTGSIQRELGDTLYPGRNNDACAIKRRSVDTGGLPVAGAAPDVWQADNSSFYDVQRCDVQPPDTGRDRFPTAPGRRFWYRAVTACHYPSLGDGPVGRLPGVTGRHPCRPAQPHVNVDARGCAKLTTRVFVAGREYLGSDIVVAVRQGLLRGSQRDSGLGTGGPLRRGGAVHPGSFPGRPTVCLTTANAVPLGEAPDWSAMLTRNPDQIKRDPGPIVVTIGHFAGVHRGHPAPAAEAQAGGHRPGFATGVLTLDRHPAMVLSTGSEPPALTDPRGKMGDEVGSRNSGPRNGGAGRSGSSPDG
jgi:protocatechuate 3,4-dioxygenase beta subunit